MSTKSNNSGVTILAIEAQNFMNLKLAKLTFRKDGSHYICGKNAAGKSALLEGLRVLLLGMAHNPDMPINEDAESASFAIELLQNDKGREYPIRVEQTWTDPNDRKKHRFKVTTDAPGFEEPRRTLKKMFSDIEFQLRPFIDDKSPEGKRKRRDAVMKTVPGLDDELTRLQLKRKNVYDDREEVGRDVRRLQGALESMDEPEDELPEEERSVVKLSANLSEVEQKIRQSESLLNEIDTLDNAAGRIRGEIAELEQKLREKAVALKDVVEENVTKVQALKVFPSPDELETIKDTITHAIADAEETNEKIRAAERYRETQQELNDVYSKQSQLTGEIEELDDQKDTLLANATFPIIGLSVSEDDITYKKKPWTVAALSERMKVALAIGISQKPDLRALFIDDGNAFDPDSLKLIHRIATKEHFQVVMAYVVAGKEDAEKLNGFYIEDGKIGS